MDSIRFVKYKFLLDFIIEKKITSESKLKSNFSLEKDQLYRIAMLSTSNNIIVEFCFLFYLEIKFALITRFGRKRKENFSNSKIKIKN